MRRLSRDAAPRAATPVSPRSALVYTQSAAITGPLLAAVEAPRENKLPS